MGVISIVVLVLSVTLMAGMIAVLVLLRKGEGPRYSASRAYDANRREAVRVLTGEVVDKVGGEQWFDPALRRPSPANPVAASYREAAAEALEAVVPADRGLGFRDGRGWLAAETVWVVPALSTAELRAGDLDALEKEGRLVVGLVLFNPEPPGGDAKRVALPIQALFPALKRVGRGDLVARFGELRGRAVEGRGTPGP